MGKKLENLRSILLWVSYIRCIKGCLNYLKMDVSSAWLFGATGHAFIINICDGIDINGPTALNYQEMFFNLGENIGYKTNMVSSFKSEADFAEKQELAWEKAKQAIDKGLPCYGWNLDTRFPEFYVVYGYDDVGYYFCGPGAARQSTSAFRGSSLFVGGPGDWTTRRRSHVDGNGGRRGSGHAGDEKLGRAHDCTRSGELCCFRHAQGGDCSGGRKGSDFAGSNRQFHSCVSHACVGAGGGPVARER